MRKNSIKNTRINGEVQKELSTLINREIKDPRINPMTSVVSVEVAPDLKTARVYISVLGDDESKKSTLLGLKSAASYMRGQLAKSLNLRNTPELTFILDNSIEYGVNMSKLINEVNKNLSKDEEEQEDGEFDERSEDEYEELAEEEDE
jgi:ribosome-binding factor A